MHEIRSEIVSSMVVLLCGGVISEANAWRSVARIYQALGLLDAENNVGLLITSGVSGHLTRDAGSEAQTYLHYIRGRYTLDARLPVYIEDLSRDTVYRWKRLFLASDS